ncbi:hypothetical protein [Streptosporangium sp. NPDC000396]
MNDYDQGGVGDVPTFATPEPIIATVSMAASLSRKRAVSCDG